jgi:hypothetical protein
LGVDHPLACQKFKTDIVDLFVETAADNVDASKRRQLRHAVHMALERIEWKSNRPIALFPLLRERDDSRPVKISPYIAFGKPVISGTRIPTQVISQRFRAGEEAVRAERLESACGVHAPVVSSYRTEALSSLRSQCQRGKV